MITPEADEIRHGQYLDRIIGREKIGVRLYT